MIEIASFPKVRIGNIEVPDIRTFVPDVAPGHKLRALTDITHIVIHHSGDNWPYQDGSTQAPDHIHAIYRYHTATKGWPGIGYHLIVDMWGNRYLTGGAETVRYHVATKNAHTLGICLLGNYQFVLPQTWAWLSLRELIANVRHGLGQVLPVVGHGEIADPAYATECPGRTFPQWRAVIDTAFVPHIVGGDLAATMLNAWIASLGRSQ